MPAINQILSAGGKLNMDAAKNVDIVVVEHNQVNNKSASDQGRMPASEGGGLGAPGPTSSVAEVDPDFVESVINEAQQDILDEQDLGIGNSKTTTNFDFNIQ